MKKARARTVSISIVLTVKWATHLMHDGLAPILSCSNQIFDIGSIAVCLPYLELIEWVRL